MTQTAEMILASKGPYHKPVYTLRLRYPKFIHAESLTHRILEIQPDLRISYDVPDGLMYDSDLSRNASSSRAIPVKRMIEDVKRDPVIPLWWGKNEPGMQAKAELEGEALRMAQWVWEQTRLDAIKHAELMAYYGAHKQIVNRIIETYSHINVVVTGTEWNNFFALRRHEDAQPEIRDLADKIWEAMQTCTVQDLKEGEWHLPFVDEADREAAYRFCKQGRITRDEPSLEEINKILLKISVARCARTSYFTFEGKPSSVQDDILLFDKLLVKIPLHASPAEHQCTPDERDFNHVRLTGPQRVEFFEDWKHPKLHGNLKGYMQFRKTLPDEQVPG